MVLLPEVVVVVAEIIAIVMAGVGILVYNKINKTPVAKP